MKAGLMLGVNPNSEREENDFYATNPIALRDFLNVYKEKINVPVWEPACGQGHLAEELISNGYDVIATDLIDRGYGDTGVDFLSVLNDKHDGDILTNPPFKLAEEFVVKGISQLKNNNKLIMLLKIQFLEGQARKKLFEKYPPKYVYCHSKRQQCSKNADFENLKATTQFYAWFVWEKGYNGETIIRWI